MSGGRSHTIFSDVGTSAMGPSVLSCRGGARVLRAPSVRRGAATAAGWSTVDFVVVVSIGIAVIPVVVAGVLRNHTRHQILHLCKHLLFAGLEVLLAALHTIRHSRKLVRKD